MSRAGLGAGEVPCDPFSVWINHFVQYGFRDLDPFSPYSLRVSYRAQAFCARESSWIWNCAIRYAFEFVKLCSWFDLGACLVDVCLLIIRRKQNYSVSFRGNSIDLHCWKAHGHEKEGILWAYF